MAEKNIYLSALPQSVGKYVPLKVGEGNRPVGAQIISVDMNKGTVIYKVVAGVGEIGRKIESRFFDEGSRISVFDELGELEKELESEIKHWKGL